MLFSLPLKKVQMVKNAPCYIPTTQHNIPLAKFLIASMREKALTLNVISKSMNFKFEQKEDFFGKTN